MKSKEKNRNDNKIMAQQNTFRVMPYEISHKINAVGALPKLKTGENDDGVLKTG